MVTASKPWVIITTTTIDRRRSWRRLSANKGSLMISHNHTVDEQILRTEQNNVSSLSFSRGFHLVFVWSNCFLLFVHCFLYPEFNWHHVLTPMAANSLQWYQKCLRHLHGGKQCEKVHRFLLQMSRHAAFINLEDLPHDPSPASHRENVLSQKEMLLQVLKKTIFRIGIYHFHFLSQYSPRVITSKPAYVRHHHEW